MVAFRGKLGKTEAEHVVFRLAFGYTPLYGTS